MGYTGTVIGTKSIPTNVPRERAQPGFSWIPKTAQVFPSLHLGAKAVFGKQESATQREKHSTATLLGAGLD